MQQGVENNGNSWSWCDLFTFIKVRTLLTFELRQSESTEFNWTMTQSESSTQISTIPRIFIKVTENREHVIPSVAHVQPQPNLKKNRVEAARRLYTFGDWHSCRWSIILRRTESVPDLVLQGTAAIKFLSNYQYLLVVGICRDLWIFPAVIGNTLLR